MRSLQSRHVSGEHSRNRPGSFVLSSPAVQDGGTLPVEFTGDGASATLPLEWTGAPAETKSYALIMHHEAPDQTKWYWILYDIPADTHSLPKNVKGVGTLGNNSVNRRPRIRPAAFQRPGSQDLHLHGVCAVGAAANHRPSRRSEPRSSARRHEGQDPRQRGTERGLHASRRRQRTGGTPKPRSRTATERRKSIGEL